MKAVEFELWMTLPSTRSWLSPYLIILSHCRDVTVFSLIEDKCKTQVNIKVIVSEIEAYISHTLFPYHAKKPWFCYASPHAVKDREAVYNTQSGAVMRKMLPYHNHHLWQTCWDGVLVEYQVYLYKVCKIIVAVSFRHPSFNFILPIC